MRGQISVRRLGIVAIVMFSLLAYWTVDEQCSWILCGVFAFFSALIIIKSILFDVKNENYFSATNIGNAFLFMIFVARPFQILLFPDSAINMHSFRMYSVIYGFSLDTMPIARASLIGLLGVCGFNFGAAPKGKYIRPLQNRREDVLYVTQKRLTAKQAFYFCMIILAAIASEILYIYKSLILSSRISIEDLAWMYAFSVVIMYSIFIRREAGILTYLVILNCIAVFAISARRQYVVNMLLYYIVPLYYVGKNKKRDMKRIAIMGVLLIMVVLVYGSIRRQRIDYETGGILFELMDEFCMFDMLTVSLKHVEDHSIGLFWGYNYLTIFDHVIPFLKIQQFDHMMTDIVMNGRYGGAMPSSLCGSLYFNFSYIGVMAGMLLLGCGIRKFERRMAVFSIDSIGYYTVFVAFVYDLIRVGDIGREFWTMMVSLIAFVVLKRIIPIKTEINESTES